ncbi:MAG: DUF1854 domain-containing protein [bacterium]
MSAMNGDHAKEEPMSLADAAQMTFLDPARISFERSGAHLRLTVDGDRSVLRTVVTRIFPLTHPNQYLSVRDGSGTEVGILRSLDRLDETSRSLVEGDLARRYFLPVIHRITAVVERFGTVEWQVDTDRGKYRFTTRDMRDNVLRLGGGRYIIQDVDENRYEVRNATLLDRPSLTRLLRHL